MLGKLLKMGAINKVSPCKNQFISNIFLRDKPDGSKRLILNLKQLNEFVFTSHFKLENYKTVSKLINRDCYLASLDLKDAYFLVSVRKNHRKYLRFKFQGTIYEFTCLPFGLSCAPRTFTKILKPVLALLRGKGLVSNIYLDDLLLIGNTVQDCQFNVLKTVNLLQKLGFIINYQKSCLNASQTITYLGFYYDSRELTISLPVIKQYKILQLLKSIGRKKSCKIREFARFIGSLISCCPALPYSWMYVKNFESLKTKALHLNKGNYNASLSLTSWLDEDFQWWETHLSLGKPLVVRSFVLEIFSDASLTGWGVFCKGQRTHGHWSPTEATFHINYLEIKAAFFGLKCFASDLSNCTILCRIDNITAIACINRMGSVQSAKLNYITRKLWQWCENKQLVVMASYVKSSENKEADEESRKTKDDNEFELNDEYFLDITQKFGMPDIDLFASRTNKKCKMFVSWHKDPESTAVDAFTLNWSSLKFYAFPPFSQILRVLNKIEHDEATGIVVVPKWETQPWFPKFLSLLTENCISFAPSENLLSFPNRLPHPLHQHLTLVAGVLSGKRS